MSEPPLPAKGNFHNAIAIALGKQPQESNATLVNEVYKLVAEVKTLRAQLAEAKAAAQGPDLFTAFDQEAS